MTYTAAGVVDMAVGSIVITVVVVVSLLAGIVEAADTVSGETGIMVVFNS